MGNVSPCSKYDTKKKQAINQELLQVQGCGLLRSGFCVIFPTLPSFDAMRAITEILKEFAALSLKPFQ